MEEDFVLFWEKEKNFIKSTVMKEKFRKEKFNIKLEVNANCEMVAVGSSWVLIGNLRSNIFALVLFLFAFKKIMRR